MDQMLYQYGSNKRCFGILNDHALRLSDIRKSNDYDELLIMYPQIFDEILLQYERNPFPLKYENLNGMAAMRELVSCTSYLLDKEIDTGAFSNFVTCFSEEPDLLSQWRGYSDNGKACCLGFSLPLLQEYCEKSNGVLRIEKVRYVAEAELEEIVAEYAREILDTLHGLREWIVAEMTHDDNDKDTDGLLGFNFHGMLKNTLTDSLILKGNGFSEEKEWRMFLCNQAYKEPSWIIGKGEKLMVPRGFSETLTYLRNRIEFNITEDNMSPYIPIRFEDFDAVPVQEIWLGPKSRISECDLKLYLSMKGYAHVKIIPSRISYR